MDINYTEMINHDLIALSQDNLRKAWSYVNALTTLQRSEEELKAIEYDLGIRREQAENSDIIDAEVKRCSFYGKPLSKVRRMIADSASLICSECVELCKEILDESDPPVDIHMPLKNLGFTRRALIALENAGYTEVGQMMELTENQMRNLSGIGNVAANNIIATLKTVGVYLK